MNKELWEGIYLRSVWQEIEEVDTDDHYVPKSAIGIKDVTLEQKI